MSNHTSQPLTTTSKDSLVQGYKEPLRQTWGRNCLPFFIWNMSRKISALSVTDLQTVTNKNTSMSSCDSYNAHAKQHQWPCMHTRCATTPAKRKETMAFHLSIGSFNTTPFCFTPITGKHKGTKCFVVERASYKVDTNRSLNVGEKTRLPHYL